MKKLLVVLLTLALCVTTLASCDFITNLFGEKEPEVVYDVNAAADYVYNLYKNKTTTNVDFKVTAKVNIAGVMHDVEWSVDTNKVTIEKFDDNNYLVNVDEKSKEEVKYVLTATIKGGDKTATKSFNLTVPVYALMTWDEYIAAEKDATITAVEGVVTGIVSKSAGATYNCVFLQDATGGAYYVYGMADDPAELGIEIGMTVSATGKKDIYSGTHEIKEGSVVILSKEKTPVTPADYTEIFKNAATLKDASLVTYQSSLVTIKGVEIGGQALANGYLYFELGGKETYLRISGSVLAFNSADKDAFISAHGEKRGWKADVTGIISLYDGSFYLVPVSTSAFNYIEKIEKTPEQMVQEAIEVLTLPTFISENTTLELPAASTLHDAVTFAWSVANDGYTITDNKIALTVSETPVELKLTVVATCGDKTATKDITIKVALPEMSIKEALELEDGASVVLVGVVTGIKDAWSDKYSNISVYLTDATGELLLYRLSTNVKVGDVIKVTGKMGSYNGSKQLAQGATAEILTVSTSAEATAAADGTSVILAGKVTNIAEKDAWSEKYSNMSVTITDAAGTYYLFRISTKVELGDEIVVIGKVGSYNGAKQIAQGSTTIITKKAEVEGGEEGGDNTDAPAKPTTDPLATFTFGDNGDAAHVDGDDLGETATYTAGNYTLELSAMSKVYGPAFDKTGNSCIKMGTSSKTGTLSFTVANDVNVVVIRVAAYKANSAKVTVNGTEYDISANKSDDGSYYEIVIDTSSTKTVTLATVSGACRAMVDAIAFYA